MCSVTIIIPMYNSEKTIERCLNSCVEQTLKDIEIICINDGSTDGTLNILKKYKSKYNNIRIINQKNRGTGYSRNQGIKVAQGKYVCFMDSDDYYPEITAIEKMIFYANENHALICGGSARFIRNGRIMGRDDHIQRKQAYFKENGMMEYKKYQCFVGFGRFIYQREMLLNNNIFFPETTEYEDPVFFVKAMICAKKFYAMTDDTYCVTIGQHMREYNTDTKVLEALYGINEVLRLAVSNNLVQLHNNLLYDIYEIKYNILMYAKESTNNEINDLLNKFLNNIVLEWLETDDCSDIRQYFTAEGISTKIAEGKKELNRFNDIVKKNSEIWIYGAGIVAEKLVDYIEDNLQEHKVNKILVSCARENPKYIKNIAVEQCDADIANKNVLIIISIMGSNGKVMKNKLEQMGFRNVYWCDFSMIRMWI